MESAIQSKPKPIEPTIINTETSRSSLHRCAGDVEARQDSKVKTIRLQSAFKQEEDSGWPCQVVSTGVNCSWIARLIG